MIREAKYYLRLPDGVVQCRLCPADCRLKPDQRGICRNRYNSDGILLTDNFGETVTIAIDPIEKKPLYHFLPTSDIISIGPNGCNFSCRHCQNWQISQEIVETTYIAPEKLPDEAAQHGSIGVAYTYTEPMIWFEYILEAAPLVRKAGLANVMVTNGYINLEPFAELLPLIDAFNIDLKGMRPEFYRQVCKGKLEPVLDLIRMVAKSGTHLELTNLVIPGMNDTDDDFHKLGKFVSSVDKNIPIHLSAYHPSYKMDNPITPADTLKRGYKILSEYLGYIFVGNMQLNQLSDSRCQSCRTVLIERSGYRVRIKGLNDSGVCNACGADSNIVIDKKRFGL